MLNRSILQRASQWLAIAALLTLGWVNVAHAEPSLKQVYESAQAGRLEEAQVMMQQVLVAHPDSAKAHFVHAELFARQGQWGHAREALAAAEKLSPGLAFAKPEAVQNLRNQLVNANAVLAHNAVKTPPVFAGQPAAASTPLPWGLILLVGGGLIALGIFMFRRKTAPSTIYSPANATNNGLNGLNGPQNFGMNNGTAVPPYGQPGYGQPGYGQPAGSGLGGRVMGGLATGLAVGAGVMAAQAIGSSLMGDHRSPHPDGANNDYAPLPSNTDMGGQDFGIADNGSWDDGNALSSNDGGGGDWDS